MKALHAAALCLAALPAAAQEGLVTHRAQTGVAETADTLVQIIEGAGAKVMARIDHGAGAVSVGSDIGDSQLLIFGNPAVGTPVLEMDRSAGLHLPLKILVYEDAEGQVWLAYEDPAQMLSGTGVDTGSEAVARLAKALDTFATKAVE